jgi:hypothetical protein
MDRNESSRLGDRQAEGNLGNERVRDRAGREDETMRERSRRSEELGGSEDWRPASDMPDTGAGAGTHDNNDARNGGRDR